MNSRPSEPHSDALPSYATPRTIAACFQASGRILCAAVLISIRFTEVFSARAHREVVAGIRVSLAAIDSARGAVPPQRTAPEDWRSPKCWRNHGAAGAAVSNNGGTCFPPDSPVFPLSPRARAAIVAP